MGTWKATEGAGLQASTEHNTGRKKDIYACTKYYGYLDLMFERHVFCRGWIHSTWLKIVEFVQAIHVHA